MLCLAILPALLAVQANRAVYLDNQGVVRWQDNKQERNSHMSSRVFTQNLPRNEQSIIITT